MTRASDHDKVCHILLQIKNAERRFRDRAAAEFIDKPLLIKHLVDFISNQKDTLADRACWTLELICIRDSNLLCPFADKIAGQLGSCNSDRQRRPLARICSLLSEPSSKSQETIYDLSEGAVETMINWSFDQLIERRPVAIKVFSMQTLFHLRDRKSWIRDTLRSLLQENMHRESPGYGARARKILAQI